MGKQKHMDGEKLLESLIRLYDTKFAKLDPNISSENKKGRDKK